MVNPETDTGTDSHWTGGFQTTHWSVLVAAGALDGPESAAALEKLCADYWYSIYAFIRKRGHSHADAQDLTQDFFRHLLKKEVLSRVKREGGRFCSFLLSCLKRFLANDWRHSQTEKQGGDKQFISMDDTAELRYQEEVAEQSTPESLFERQCAVAVIERTFARLREAYRAAGKGALFDQLQGCLPGSNTAEGYSQAGTALDMKEPAVRMAAHRLRRHYGEYLREEIAATVSSPEEVDQELEHLMSVLGR